MDRARRKSLLIAVGILAAGVAGLALLVALRPEPPRVEPPRQSPLVAVVVPEIRAGNLTVRATGTVRPEREINLVAEVSGKVTSVAEALKSGGFARRGQVLLRIDPADYANAVAVAEAEVTQRQFELLTAREEVAVAREEWDRLQARTGRTITPDSTAMGALVLREPQLKAAEARLKSAQARLADARTRLARTAIAAPFNGRVRARLVDVGQFVAPGQPVAAFYSTDAVEVAVPLSSTEASLVDQLWERDRGGARIPATVTATFGGARFAWQGYVDRTEGTLDPTTRTVTVVVRVPSPYRTEGGRPPLMVGTFAEVELQGAALERYAVLPRTALREGERVWTVEADSLLRVLPVTVVQEVDEQIFVTAADLSASTPVITSNLDVFTDGMTVRVER